MVETSDDSFPSLHPTHLSVSFAKVLCFINVLETKFKCKMNAEVSSEVCETIQKPHHEVFCFVPYFEILSDKKQKMNKIEKILFFV